MNFYIMVCVYFLIYCISLSMAIAETLYIPKNLENIFIGMSEDQFRASRKNAERFEIFGETGKNKNDESLDLYIEFTADAPFFKYVNYILVKGKLCAVKLSEVGKNEEFKTIRARILQGAIRKWGGNYQKIVNNIQHNEFIQKGMIQNHLVPSLLWKVNEIEIVLSYSLTKDEAERSSVEIDNIMSIGLVIFNRECLSPSLLVDLTKNLTIAKKEHDMLFEALNDRTTSPFFE